MPCSPRCSWTSGGRSSGYVSAARWRNRRSMPREFVKQAGQILRSGKPIEERLREFTTAIGAFLSGGVSSVLLFDRDPEGFYLRSTTLRYTPSPEIFHFSSGGTVEDLALRDGRGVTLSEVPRAPRSRPR